LTDDESGEETVKARIIWLIAAVLVACDGQSKNPTESRAEAKAANPEPAIKEVVPVELGRRPPNTPMTSQNMPFFDTVTYCLSTTRKTDTMVKGPAYEQCIELQDHTRIVIGEAIDANEFKEADIVRCAKASHTAYEGMWFCMNGKPY
jgi:hypothetical protein